MDNGLVEFIEIDGLEVATKYLRNIDVNTASVDNTEKHSQEHIMFKPCSLVY